MNEHVPTAPGLRERKKDATRRALSEAALSLTIEHGLSQVLVEDIASAVGVSRRTFSNYYSSKEEAVVAAVHARIFQLPPALAARPPEETVWQALDAVVAEHLPEDTDLQAWGRMVRLLTRTPVLAAARLQMFAALEEPLSQQIASRTGTDVRADLYPRLTAAAVTCAIRLSVDQWLADGMTGCVTTAVRQAVAHLAAGLGTPHAPVIAARSCPV
ncbi:TetR/AcrR family transcriptional regulator [Streptomyces sp. NPDC052496]|uniref:TetR/AcrR family transcriptional regulator n=1 Tax=Streptomyces sp. NPDC052496 TaxID=3154951 RepID=UPI0034347C1F